MMRHHTRTNYRDLPGTLARAGATRPVSAFSRPKLIDPRFLLVWEQPVEGVKFRLDELDGIEHGREPLLHERDASGWCQTLFFRAIGTQERSRFRCRGVQRIERDALCIGRLERLDNTINRRIRCPDFLLAARLRELETAIATTRRSRGLILQVDDIETRLLFITQGII